MLQSLLQILPQKVRPLGTWGTQPDKSGFRPDCPVFFCSKTHLISPIRPNLIHLKSSTLVIFTVIIHALYRPGNRFADQWKRIRKSKRNLVGYLEFVANEESWAMKEVPGGLSCLGMTVVSKFEK